MRIQDCDWTGSLTKLYTPWWKEQEQVCSVRVAEKGEIQRLPAAFEVLRRKALHHSNRCQPSLVQLYKLQVPSYSKHTLKFNRPGLDSLVSFILNLSNLLDLCESNYHWANNNPGT